MCFRSKQFHPPILWEEDLNSWVGLIFLYLSHEKHSVVWGVILVDGRDSCAEFNTCCG